MRILYQFSNRAEKHKKYSVRTMESILRDYNTIFTRKTKARQRYF